MRALRCLPLAPLLLVSACVTAPDSDQQCGMVSAYVAPDHAEALYRVVVTHLDGKPVISRPNYRLTPGEYEFTLVELIDDPALKVALEARQTKVLRVNVSADRRYHLGAKFHTDRQYTGKDSSYWHPVVWQQQADECSLVVSPE